MNRWFLHIQAYVTIKDQIEIWPTTFGLRKQYIKYSELLGFYTFSSFGILENRQHDVSETDPVSETSCFLFSRIPDDG
jgi:hypothetical protein